MYEQRLIYFFKTGEVTDVDIISFLSTVFIATLLWLQVKVNG